MSLPLDMSPRHTANSESELLIHSINELILDPPLFLVKSRCMSVQKDTFIYSGSLFLSKAFLRFAYLINKSE